MTNLELKPQQKCWGFFMSTDFPSPIIPYDYWGDPVLIPVVVPTGFFHNNPVILTAQI